MAKPLSRLIKILGKPQHKELALKSSGLREILRPFIGFFQFCIGKLLFAIFGILCNLFVPDYFLLFLSPYLVTSVAQEIHGVPKLFSGLMANFSFPLTYLRVDSIQ